MDLYKKILKSVAEECCTQLISNKIKHPKYKYKKNNYLVKSLLPKGCILNTLEEYSFFYIKDVDIFEEKGKYFIKGNLLDGTSFIFPPYKN